ncbi:hypothetical protein B0A48_06063 [Cryoendolithus antarcticus]|uniref:F-box domain-containing protein n=1 Tax=Cryoendolithus antarcticus TaxID=1507870 RepID=A0A1V8TD96_9PEZI|nr:hypothetical protein B0A48_06063 [Cryoendolithus antarcticus]
MANPQSSSQSRCRILALPPEIRLEIYRHVDLVPGHTLKHVVVLDKNGQARVRNKSKPSPLLLTCRTFRVECKPPFSPTVRYHLINDGEPLKPGKGAIGQQRLAHYEQLDLLGDSTLIKGWRKIELSVHSPRKTGPATAKQVLIAVSAAAQIIDSATKLEELRLFFKIERKTLLDEVCNQVATMRCRKNTKLHEALTCHFHRQHWDHRLRVQKLAADLGLSWCAGGIDYRYYRTSGDWAFEP